jgi:hypothetical protein
MRLSESPWRKPAARIDFSGMEKCAKEKSVTWT